jgi:hypothetical protein
VTCGVCSESADEGWVSRGDEMGDASAKICTLKAVTTQKWEGRWRRAPYWYPNMGASGGRGLLRIQEYRSRRKLQPVALSMAVRDQILT